MTADRMLLHGMVFYGYHGVSPEEQRLGQRFVVDVELEADLSKSGDSDDLADTIDYGKVYETVAPIVQGAPYRLLEALGNGYSEQGAANVSRERRAGTGEEAGRAIAGRAGLRRG